MTSFFKYQEVFNKLIKLICIINVCLIQGCVSTNNEPTIGNLLIIEPLPVHYKSEMAIARLTQAIYRANITQEQRAEVMYQRGLEYDKVGLKRLAYFDFEQTLNLKADLPDAYNILGMHYTEQQKFNEAFDAFDSVLELAPNYHFAYMNRGISLYYAGRSDLAVDDYMKFLSLQPNDPYLMLWLYFAQVDIDLAQANQTLVNNSSRISNAIWAKQLIDLFLGNIDQKQFSQQITKNIESTFALTQRLCEAYFYLGKYNQMQGDFSSAANFFKLALSTNVYEFIEHRYARLELDLMAKNAK